jgi:hypothetical protein
LEIYFLANNPVLRYIIYRKVCESLTWGDFREEEVFMKNRVNLARIIVFAAVTVLLFAGCGEKGGTLVIENKTGEDIYGYAISGYYSESQINELNEDEHDDVLGRARYSIFNGESYTWKFSSNGNVTWCWGFDTRDIKYGGIVKLEKGSEETVPAEL